MINYGAYDITNLPDYCGWGVKTIRVAFHKKDLSQALAFCKCIKRKGYKVFVQPMLSSSYSDAEFLYLIKICNAFLPDAVYVVDSFGSMNKEEVLHYYKMLERGLNNSIYVGFHGHNNMQLAFSNAICILENANREVIIDSSIHGMGRGAGNANTEILIEYINSKYAGHYKLHPVLEAKREDGDVHELLVRELGEGAATTICCTRYGNVMASRGSVIPLWVEQMMEGKPITITDPNMTRFMMTLDDAVDLVVYAFTHGHNGDLFVQKAPAATLDTLATALKEIYSKVDPKYGETEVKVIGTRHGEKLYETLVTREEMAKAIDMGNYYRIPCDTRDLNYDKYFIEGDEKVSTIEDYHSHNTRRLDVEGMKEQLMRLRFIQEDLGMIQRAKARDIRSE